MDPLSPLVRDQPGKQNRISSLREEHQAKEQEEEDMEEEKAEKAEGAVFVESTADHFPKYIKEINSLIEKVDITREAYQQHLEI